MLELNRRSRNTVLRFSLGPSSLPTDTGRRGVLGSRGGCGKPPGTGFGAEVSPGWAPCRGPGGGPLPAWLGPRGRRHPRPVAASLQALPLSSPGFSSVCVSPPTPRASLLRTLVLRFRAHPEDPGRLCQGSQLPLQTHSPDEVTDTGARDAACTSLWEASPEPARRGRGQETRRVSPLPSFPV